MDLGTSHKYARAAMCYVRHINCGTTSSCSSTHSPPRSLWTLAAFTVSRIVRLFSNLSISYVQVICGPVVHRVVLGFFFFSSRRRHTRLVSDWSSDVCSSD